MHSRRGLLRAAAVGGLGALAGCGRSVRRNSVPGGLELLNRRPDPVTVSVRATTVEEVETPSGDDAEPTPRAIDPVVLEGTYDVDPRTERAVPNFFPGGDAYLVEASEGGATDRTALRLYDSVPGPAGADTVIVRLREGGELTAMATKID